MKVGDLCKVVKAKTHAVCQKNDLVLITKPYLSEGVPDGEYVEGMHLKTHIFHHYKKSELKVISESR